MPIRNLKSLCLSVLASILWMGSAQAFQDPSVIPAMPSAFAARTPLIAVEQAGKRIVAVGNRGHIVYSDDGQSWNQSQVPVSTDLVSLSFPTAEKGWAVGHNGVVLHSADGGKSWVKQLDGAAADAIAEKFYGAADAPAEFADELRKLTELRSFQASRAFLAVHFENETTGYIVGTFNRIYQTTDGGKSWTPWMHRTGNSRELHFYSIRSDGQAIWMTGEQGKVWRLAAGSEQFEDRSTEYSGTLFGSVSVNNTHYVFGMRGSLFRSDDEGASWRKLTVPVAAGITGAVGFDDGRVLFVTQDQSILSSRDKGDSFQPIQVPQQMSYFDVARVDDSRIAVSGLNGVRIVALTQGANVAADVGK